MLDLKRSFLVVSLLIVCGVTAANAQWTEGSSLKVDIPTSFTVGDTTLPAGKYTIERSSVSRSFFLIRGEGKTLYFNTVPGSDRDGTGEGKLIFDKAGESVFLAQIRFSSAPAVELPKSKTQKEAIARNKTTRTAIVADDSF